MSDSAPMEQPQSVKRVVGRPFVKGGDKRCYRGGRVKRDISLEKFLRKLGDKKLSTGETVEERVWRAKSLFRLRIADALASNQAVKPEELRAFSLIDADWNDRLYGKAVVRAEIDTPGMTLAAFLDSSAKQVAEAEGAVSKVQIETREEQ
jgi:hypothetical protein